VAGSRRVLVLCPPHLVRKWQREVLATVPGAGAAIVRTITDLERLPLLGGRPLFAILSRECASPLWQADRSGPRRFPLADYVGWRMPGFFDLLVVGEAGRRRPRRALREVQGLGCFSDGPTAGLDFTNHA